MTAQDTTATGIGAAVRRKEDLRFITGKGQYTDDISRPGETRAVFVRSPHAHARIKAVDTKAAAAMSGVLAVLTGAQLAGDKPGVFDAIVQNAACADETIATLAERGGAREVDRIAANEQRLLRYPAIISAMYLNKQARMSTVDRVIELAVRNNVRVPGLAAWDEIGDRTEEIVPAYGFVQAERELASVATASAPASVDLRNGHASTTRQGGKSVS